MQIGREMWRVLALVAVVSYGAGCNQSTSPPSKVDTPAPAVQTSDKKDDHDHDDHDHDDHDHDHGKKTAKHDHSGWWCNEHGVPEEVCGLCNTKLAAAFQKKGDWCKEHDRPDSQCFICHPELKAKFAAQYEAKYGKQPPKPEVN